MTNIQTYGYDEGWLSNSMLQAAICCPLKYKLLYIDKVLGEGGKDGTWFNAAWVGNLVHAVIEHCDDDVAAGEVWLQQYLDEVVGKGLSARTMSLLRLHSEAVEKTREDGRRFGKEYKAPEMTSFWKKNYGGLETLMKSLDVDVESALGVGGVGGAVFDEPFTELIRRAMVCIHNWPKMKLGEALHSELKVRGLVGPPDAETSMIGTVDRIEPRGREDGKTGYAICDFKTGKWGHDIHWLANSDQFGLYDKLCEGSGVTPVIEWCVYDIYLGKTTRFKVTPEARQRFGSRLGCNLHYYKNMIGYALEQGGMTPVPAGMPFKVGCPCILAKTGDCKYVIMSAEALVEG